MRTLRWASIRAWCWLLAPLAIAAWAEGSPPIAAAPGIAWYQGDVAAAFEAARLANKPVMLYWGAKWCPPCHQLKSFVFTRKDFIEKSKQFVAVYLDGDDPGAQKWAEQFHVVGYPTVVILRADRVEITRIAGGNDLSLYANLLESALSDIKPLAEVLGTLHSRPAALTRGDCRRLAYYAWSVGDYSALDPKSLAGDLAQAARNCGDLTAAERARLIINSAALSPMPQTTDQVIAIVHDSTMAARVVDALEGLQEPFYATVLSRSPSVKAQFEADWIKAMDAVADDPALTDADRLYAIGAKLTVVKQFAADKKVPADLAAAARARVAAARAKHVDPYVRSGIVDTASFVYQALGDDDDLYEMLKSEVSTAKAPFYYMNDLADLEEGRGHAAEALSWHERAYRESKGAATRFQWGVNYLACLLRLAPTDHERIRKVGIEVIAELDGPDRIHARSRSRLEKLDARLRTWNADHRYDADIKALQARMRSVCARLPNGDGGAGACRQFLS